MEKILVVEDDDTIREVLSYAISEFGHEVYGAGNGAEAVEILRVNPKISVVILDLRMPVMDGYELCPLIKKLNPGIEIIISSAFVEEEAVKGFNDIGVRHILRKPYPLTHLREIIDNLSDNSFR